METRRWTNPSQPQTLYVATFLLYINAAFALLFGGFVNPIVWLVVGVEVGSALGIANERKWGYLLAVGVSTLSLLWVCWPLVFQLSLIFNPRFLLDLLFPVALFALLVHPQSREYQKIWFH